MRDANLVVLTGFLGAEPVMRYTTSGKSVTNFSIAINSGDTQPTWVRCVAWDKLAILCNDMLQTGTRVHLQGRLQVREYTDKDGVRRSVTEVILSEMIPLANGRFVDSVEPEPEPEPEPANTAPVKSTAKRK